METNKSCPCCGQQFLLEPGFFLGSAYFSYPDQCSAAIAYAVYFLGLKLTIGAMVISAVVVIFGLLPFTLRFPNQFVYSLTR